ncbi:Rossmann-like and DUF2520 domain-containing protein [Brumimicrobium oceani]|uniref:DUF2520 domain-containing protein n=1 Tax=Brumimicrobium oceani TaxID=2100725 RepID=A0A2U2X1C3_9FLAO|nr:Rossmann-like and DUF2520 domain-containing protein [Brumimicrobium oceani]PWH81585.1 DUF2520 domain-containing protein [Brumimicrobium oceani]
MTKKKEHIVIIGTGKVAQHLGLQLIRSGHKIKYVWGRNISKAKRLAKLFETNTLPSLEQLPKEYLALVCVSDDAIKEVVSQLPKEVKVAYTSGSVKLEDIADRPDIGVFYPLQSFSEERNINISIVPFLIEATQIEFQDDLKRLAKSLSSKVIIADSQVRFNTHIAAVMVNNFTNFLYHLAQEHLNENKIDFNLLKPLMRETINKLDELTPIEAQTGPAVRGDKKIIEKHINALSNPETKQVYRLLSELIHKEINKS